MRFLIDNPLSPNVAAGLRSAGHEAQHLGEIASLNSSDQAIADLAERTEAVVITADSDFGEIVKSQQRSRPSVVLFRGATPRRAADQVDTLLANLEAIEDRLQRGAIVVIEPGRVRIRMLPISDD